MRSILQILLVILLTIGLVLGLSLVFAQTPESAPAPQPTTLPETLPETAPPTTEATIPPTVPETTAETEPTLSFHTVPRYYQTDYPYEKFSEGTVISSGCSVTCLAMVATYLTEQVYTPDQLAYHFNVYGLDNVEKFQLANQTLQLPNTRTDDVQEAYEALQQGKVVIAMMDGESSFTNSAHFIVLAGLTEDGRVIINDPYEKIYEGDEYMTSRYRDGFERFHMFQGFNGAWIYDKDEMPQEPFLFDASLPQQPENRYQGYRLTEEDAKLLAKFLRVEAAKESPQVRQAIAEVLLNRVVSRDFPFTVRDVLFKGEYAPRIKQMNTLQEVEQEYYDAVNAAMFGPYVLPEDVYYFDQWNVSGKVWDKLDSYTFLHSR